jgi:hypothetical protein
MLPYGEEMVRDEAPERLLLLLLLLLLALLLLLLLCYHMVLLPTGVVVGGGPPAPQPPPPPPGGVGSWCRAVTLDHAKDVDTPCPSLDYQRQDVVEALPVASVVVTEGAEDTIARVVDIAILGYARGDTPLPPLLSQVL